MDPASIKRRHSRLGIGSFALFLAAVFLGIGPIVIGFIIGGSKPRGFFLAGSTEVNLIIFGAVVFSFLTLTSLGLGVAGLCQKGCKKIFAILGTVWSGLIVLGVLVLSLLGLILGLR